MIGTSVSTLPASTIVAFILLVVAMATLWAQRRAATPLDAGWWWTLPFALSLVAALGGGLLDGRGLAVLLLLAGACQQARTSTSPVVRATAFALMLALCAGLLLHVVPGFDNPKVLDAVRLAPDSLPYTKYLNFDKGVAGLFLLGVYAPSLTARRSRAGVVAWLWRFVLMSAVVMAVTTTLGYARWDPKLPPWWPLWLVSMVFLTALPEEALFRGVIQERLHGWLGDSPSGRWGAATVAGLIFGAAHAGGGWTYVGLAAIAGIGYGWLYAVTGALGASILAHAGLNLLHLMFFSYPALAGSLPN